MLYCLKPSLTASGRPLKPEPLHTKRPVPKMKCNPCFRAVALSMLAVLGDAFVLPGFRFVNPMLGLRRHIENVVWKSAPSPRDWRAYPLGLRRETITAAVSGSSAPEYDDTVQPLSRYIQHFRLTSECRMGFREGMGWGILANRDLDPGDPLVVLPRGAVIEAIDGEPNPFEEFVSSEFWQSAEPYIKLALHVMFRRRALEKKGSEDHVLDDYIRLLPVEHHSALSWTQEELEQLQDKESIHRMQKHHSKMNDCYSNLCAAMPEPVGWNVFCWAIQSVLSRSFGFEDKGNGPQFSEDANGGTACLLPLIDSANHSPDVQGTDVKFDMETNSFVLTTDTRWEKDQEVCISYGQKDNSVLLFCYGFILEDNPADDVQLCDAWTILKRDFPPLSSLPPAEKPDICPRITRDLMDGTLIDFAGELHAQLQSPSSPPQRSFPALATGLTLSPLDDPLVLDALLLCTEVTLAAFPTTEEEDFLLLEQLDDTAWKMRLAIRFRVQKKRLLAEAIQRLRQRKACVEDVGSLLFALLPENIPGV